MQGFIVGRILSTEPVPKSKMTKTLTDIGKEQLVILTNAQVEVGQKVVVITVGTTIEEDGKLFTIEKRNMKGIDSYGMFHGNENGLIKPVTLIEDEVGNQSEYELEIGDEYVI